MKRNISPLIAMVIGVAVVFFGIMDSGGNVLMFISISSLFIVLGGSIAALGIIYSATDLKRLPKVFKALITEQRYNLIDLVLLFEQLSLQSRKEGVLSLEYAVEDLEDDFLKKGIQLVVDGSEVEEIKQILYTEIDVLENRHTRNQEIINKMGALAPGFGMIGTVIGLIIMLGNLSTNPEELGAGMATALITTFYGSFLANLIFEPVAANLRIKTDDEMMFRNIMVEGIFLIQNGTNPRVVKEVLMTYLSPDQKEELLTRSVEENE